MGVGMVLNVAWVTALVKGGSARLSHLLASSLALIFVDTPSSSLLRPPTCPALRHHSAPRAILLPSSCPLALPPLAPPSVRSRPPSHCPRYLALSRRPEPADTSAVGGLCIAGGVGSIIHLSFSSIIIGIYEIV